MTAWPASHHQQVLVLTRAFLARFFENDSAAGQTDLRESFFWLIGFLAAPGVFFAFYEQFYWQFALTGPDAAARLRAYVLHDKAFYLTLTMVVMGVITIATRNALAIDRRDALILGVLPVRPMAIVMAKLLALTGYVGVLSLGMHAGAAVLFGAFLADLQGGVSIPIGAVAHLVAATTAGMFVFVSFVAVECVCVALAGPRRFARVAGAVQTLLLIAIVAALFITPALSREAGAMTGAAGAANWLVYAPPAWFLGLYETLSGAASSAMQNLAGTATRALASVVFLTAVFYPIASRRILKSAVAEGDTVGQSWRRTVSARTVRLLAKQPGVQAALQFLTATTGRVGRFRLTISGAVGLGLIFVAPLGLYWTATGLPERPSASLLAMPLLLAVPLTAGWRVITSMPSELNARWVFLAAPLDGFAGRTAVTRIAFTTGVLMPTVLVVPAWIAAWGIVAAVPFATNTLLAGGILVEAQFWGYAGVPCTRPVAVSESNLQGRWPFYVFGLLVYAAGLPAIHVWLSGRPVQWTVTVVLGLGCLIVRGLSARAAHLNIATNDHRGLILLDLGIVPPVHGRVRRTSAPVARTTVARETPHA